jgi:hypothetical protein
VPNFLKLLYDDFYPLLRFIRKSLKVGLFMAVLCFYLLSFICNTKRMFESNENIFLNQLFVFFKSKKMFNNFKRRKNKSSFCTCENKEPKVYTIEAAQCDHFGTERN